MTEAFGELMERHGIDIASEGHRHCRPGWIQVDCAFCGVGSQKFHMGYNLQWNYFHCWRCGGHNAWHTMRAMGIPEKVIAAFIQNNEENRILPGERLPHRGKYKPPDNLLPAFMESHKQYLRSRDIDPAAAFDVWGMRSVGLASVRHRYRLFIPVVVGEAAVSWTTRSVNPLSPMRYLSASSAEEAVPHKHLLLGEDLIRSTVIVFEGPFDAIRIGPGATCTFGTAYSSEQVARIARFPRRYVCFDNEPEAQRKQRELVGLLSVLPGETFEVELAAKDASAARKREAAELRALLA